MLDECSHAKVRLLRETRNVLYEMHALLLVHCFLVPRPVIQRFVMAAHADLQFSSLLIMYDEGHSTTWISTISIYAFITWEWKEEEYFIHCIVMEARTCSTMILLFNINCHYERCKLHIDNVVHMTSPSIFTFNIKKCYKYVLWKLNDYILKICQISKKGIYYSSIQGHILYSHSL
ncbi:hypothetical protein T07_964 [Trichinella nelsoni]|uniref:Uncharacterized protein n=1 Tax=Trichinella nelsoni TaxID=6336 RepID=A0A0V0S5P9_9BILA|nr:hypothetical protein T07_964 [Trichinella nelsoni]